MNVHLVFEWSVLTWGLNNFGIAFDCFGFPLQRCHCFKKYCSNFAIVSQRRYYVITQHSSVAWRLKERAHQRLLFSTNQKPHNSINPENLATRISSDWLITWETLRRLSNFFSFFVQKLMQKDKKFADFIKVCFRMKSNYIVINRITLRLL